MRIDQSGAIREARSLGGVVIELIDDEASLADLLAEMSGVSRYGIDTEFHREKTFWPVLALVQLSWQEPRTGKPKVALVDPLNVEISPLAAIIGGPATMVAHACDQDLEIIRRACGVLPNRLLDTQIAAGFAGHSAASLASLVKSFLGKDLGKGDRLTDWQARPLSSSQLHYAASDVEHLLVLADAITADLDTSGRTTWVDQECRALLERCARPADPRKAWWKLRDSRSLKGASRGVAQEVAAWREGRAARVDQPVRYVLADLVVQAIAHRPPATLDALNSMRGLDGRHLRAPVAEEILQAVDRGKKLREEEILQPPSEDVPKELRAPVALMMAWIAQVARSQRIDPALLATRSDVAAFVRDDPECRLTGGWRGTLVLKALQALREGRGALTFSSSGNLLLEESSGVPIQL